MKKEIFTIIALLICTFAFCATPDTAASHLVGNISASIYDYFLAQIPAGVQYFIATLLAVGLPMLFKFAAELKADPNKKALGGFIGFIANAATWFQEDIQAGSNGNDNSKKN